MLVYSISKPPRWPLKKIFRKACLHVAGCVQYFPVPLSNSKISFFVEVRPISLKTEGFPSPQSSFCRFCPSLVLHSRVTQFSSWSSVLEGALLSSFDSEQERTPNGEWRRETPLPARRHRVNALYAPSCEERAGRKETGELAGELPSPPPPVRRGGCWLALLFALSLFFFTFAPSATVETSASACVTDPERPRDRVRRRRRARNRREAAQTTRRSPRAPARTPR